MADLSLLQDSQEVAECLLDFVSQDELLTPLGRIDKYISSENVFNRQMVARSLLDTLRAVSEDERECVAVLEKINRLADDSEPTVRAELMEQIPHIALFILENQNLLQNQNQEQEQILPLAFSRILLPVLLRCLNDQNNLVRKTSQAALLVLLEQRVIGQWDLEQRVCPVLVDLTAPHSNDDLKTEAMAIMCKMAPLVGKEVTERLFLPRFCEMCCDCRMFHVRKVCAASFGDMCSVVGGEATEELLLPRFYQLCSDNVWGVRKACAECFMSVSAAASPETRQNKLSALFINLISDPSRWVRQAAFQSLGQFISTFASPVRDRDHLNWDQTHDRCINPGSPVGSQDCISYNPSGCQVEEAELHLAEEGGGEERAESLNPEELGQGSSSEAQMDPPGPTLELESSCVARPGQSLSSEFQSDSGLLTEAQLDSKHLSIASNNHHFSSREQIEPEALLETQREPEVSIGTQSETEASLRTQTDTESLHESQADLNLENLEDSLEGQTELLASPCPQLETDIQESSSAAQIESDASYHVALETEAPLGAQTTPEGSFDSHLEPDIFNSFQFWRTPLLQIDLDLELLQKLPEVPGTKCLDESQGPHSQNSLAPRGSALGRRQLQELIENLEPHTDDPDVKAQVEVLTAALSSLDPRFEEEAFLEPRVAPSNPCSCLEGSEQQFSHTKVSDSALCSTHEDCDSDGSDGNMNPEDDRKSRQQDVVPQALLDQYLSMTDPSRAQTVDMEIAKHCAYSLPGVALTLGRQNWHCLRDTYETLASDMQWKVRRTLAFSLHELAGILGDRITATHLLPVFNSFLKDLDEVRIGVLKHLYDFLKLLRPDTRRQYLYQLQEFLVTDNSRNWRFRSELAEQLVLLLELYSPQDVHDYLRPLAFCLCSDRVSSVRWTAYRLVTEMVRKLSSCSSLLLSFLSELVEKFGRSPKWSCRQAFAFLCQVCVEDDCVSLQNFSEYLLPALLCLASDPVPNVRVLLAKTLRQTLLQKEYFLCHQQEALEHTLLLLQTDGDKDVKYFASYHPGSTRMNEDAMSTTSSTY